MLRRTLNIITVSTALLAMPGLALAHEGSALEPHDLWQAWEFDPVVLALLLVSGLTYAVGVARLWEHGSDHDTKKRVSGHPRGVRSWNIACYIAGWLSLVVALVSPLHSMGSVLFSAHMAQHEVLMVISAPLLVLGRPLVPYLWSMPKRLRSGIANAIRRPLWKTTWSTVSSAPAAWTLHAAALWIWHIPALFQATITNEWIHAMQHFSFLGSALLFTWSLLQTYNGRRQYGAAVAYVFTTAVHTSLLGALLTFTTRIWYPVYSTTTAAWGYSPLEDQQLGGLIMWVPAGVIYTVAGLAFFGLWISQSDRSPELSTVTLGVREETSYGQA
jgi:cytochrome c oxidase assembly factor CtaG